LLFLALLSGLNCSGGRRESPEQAFLRRYENAVQSLERKAGLLRWQASLSEDHKIEAKLVRAVQKLRDFYCDAEIFGKLRAFRDKKPGDPAIRQQLDILYNLHWPYQTAKPLREAVVTLESDLGQDYYQLRFNVSGEVLSLDEGQKRLSESTLPGDRQVYWECLLKRLRPLDPKFRRLASLRNQAARDLGFQNYFDQMLAVNGVDKDDFLAMLDDLEFRSAEPFARLFSEASGRLSRHYGIREDELRPWHWPDPFYLNRGLAASPDLNQLYQDRDHIRIGLDFFKALNMDLKAVVERSELYNKKAKEPGAFTIFVNREHDYSLLLKPLIRWESPPDYDVRIVLSVCSDAVFLERLLHQLGHAAYLKNIDKKLPFVLRQVASQDVSEGVATYFGSLIYDASWIQSFVPGSSEDARTQKDDFRRLFLSGLLASLRQKLCHLRFEQALYDHPDQDLQGLWRGLTERFLMVRSPEDWDNPDYLFYEDFLKWPGFEQHFIYGFLICAQIRHYIETHFARSSADGRSLDWPAVGRFFKDKIFSVGATYPWPRLVEIATGERLNPAHFFSQFVDLPAMSRGARESLRWSDRNLN
jgi:peptidyl-dipeptidase A